MTYLFLWMGLITSIIMATTLVLVTCLIYPQFFEVGHLQLVNYAKMHMSRISYFLVPVIFLEGVSLLVLLKDERAPLLIISCLFFVIAIVLTCFQVVPIHKSLVGEGVIDSTTEKQMSLLIQKLNQKHLIRTCFWLLKIFFFCLFFWIHTAQERSYLTLIQASVDDRLNSPNYHSVIIDKPLDHVKSTLLKQLFSYTLLQDEPSSIKVITKTAFFQFPDLIVLEERNSHTHIHSRSLLGYSDFGVNQKRLQDLHKRLLKKTLLHKAD